MADERLLVLERKVGGDMPVIYHSEKSAHTYDYIAVRIPFQK